MHFLGCEHHKFKNFLQNWWNIQVRKNSASVLEKDKALRSLNLKAN